MDESNWIEAHHPLTGGEATFEKDAFDAVWADLGWVEGPLPVSEEEDPVFEPEPDPVPPIPKHR